MNKKDRKQIYDDFLGHCAYCGCELEYKDMQVDHIKPKHLSGTDDITNCMPSCRACNFYKATFDIETFRKRIAAIPKRLNGLFIFRLALKYGLVEVKDKNVVFLFEQCDKCALNGFCKIIEHDTGGEICDKFQEEK